MSFDIFNWAFLFFFFSFFFLFFKLTKLVLFLDMLLIFFPDCHSSDFLDGEVFCLALKNFMWLNVSVFSLIVSKGQKSDSHCSIRRKF